MSQHSQTHKKRTIHFFPQAKASQNPITMVTSYDYWSAQILESSNVDCVLVGDSVSTVVYGYQEPVHADIDMMCRHTGAVSKAIQTKFLVSDMPFLSTRKGVAHAMDSVDQLMKAGAHSVKIEGIDGHEDIIAHIIQSGVPVMGHIGLTPQFYHQLGGFRVQGKDDTASNKLLHDAKRLQELGCFAIVIECVPQAVAAHITQALSIPTIGIGAGPGVDGQVLVFQDMMGLNQMFTPKFVKHYAQAGTQFVNAVNEYVQDVQSKTFPDASHCYS